jgi:hypothetical protein
MVPNRQFQHRKKLFERFISCSSKVSQHIDQSDVGLTIGIPSPSLVCGNVVVTRFCMYALDVDGPFAVASRYTFYDAAVGRSSAKFQQTESRDSLAHLMSVSTAHNSSASVTSMQ